MVILYLVKWFFQAKFLGKKRPLQTVLFISDPCNTACESCSGYRKENPSIKTYEQIREELEYSYRSGSRFVDFEGGEPTVWRDGEHDLNSLIRLARQIGFFSTTVTTNAQQPFIGCEADFIWVSLDGAGHFHDDVHGKGTFGKLAANVKNCRHPNVHFNMAINTINCEGTVDVIAYTRNNPFVRSVWLNFQTPFPGSEALCVDRAKREEIIGDIIRMKKKGYPVMNSVSGLERMKQNRFNKQCWITNYMMPDGTRYDECQGKAAGVCERCGFSLAAEMHGIFSLKRDSVLTGLKMRMKKKVKGEFLPLRHS